MLLGTAGAGAPSRAGDGPTVLDSGREAYSRPSPLLLPERLPEFFRGRGLFRQSWMIPPAEAVESAGLGPLYNRISCSACHLKNARGKPPDGPADEAGGLLIRLSLSGRAEHGGPRPHPAYGDQLQNHAVPGVPEEGRIAIEYREFPVTLADGEVVWLRQPKILLHDLHYGPLGEDVLLSARVGPALVGLGLLEAVSEPTLLALERRPKRDGIRGHVNWVWDAVARRTAIGRFGHKANVPNLPQQVASAFLGDLGITSELFPEGPCTAVQQACRWAAASGRHPELDRAQFQSIVLYVRSLAVPARRHGDDPEVVRGEAIFRAIGCNECHLDTLTTGPSAPLPELSNQTIHPYTDLLVHDLGPGLADGRPDFLAGPGEWRTAPLWGLGLAAAIAEHTTLLHDGRARTVLEALLWHGGEAATARDRVIGLGQADRRALLRFLDAL
ncbi:di-heme oxidoredictase family protein [Candidatus Methylocalor cossyra]|uniref:Thiol oxidoreductase n=1 Tax=Candidatus Methylocalor cossyra TaxID=3108543 RepID=A0ABP1C945_9GAMM